MRSIFDITHDIVHKKNTGKLNHGDKFQPYMLQRVLSMVSPEYTSILNDIFNIRSSGFDDNQQLYDYLQCIVPKQNIRKIDYISKPKEKKIERNPLINELSEKMEITSKEIDDLLVLFPDLLDDLKEEEKTYRKKIAK